MTDYAKEIQSGYLRQIGSALVAPTLALITPHLIQGIYHGLTDTQIWYIKAALLCLVCVLWAVYSHQRVKRAVAYFKDRSFKIDRQVRTLVERMENEKIKCPDASAKTTMQSTQENLETISKELNEAIPAGIF